MTKFGIKLFLLVLLIASLGIITIYSSTAHTPSLAQRQLYLRQIIWVLLGFVCLFVISRIYYRRLWDFAYLFYAIGVFFLILVAFAGLTRLGAQRWMKILWFNFQPSELMKLAVIIFLARYFNQGESSLRQEAGNWGFVKAAGIPLMIVLFSAALILLQPDLGTAAFIILIFIGMLFAAGVNLRYVFLIIAGMILTSPLFWYFLKDYQKARSLVFINPNLDPLGAGYTIIQSKTAIASGGLFGRGWLGGSQSQLRFLPESHTDFIFATFAEEWGLFGSALLLFLYFILIRWLLRVAEKAPDSFGRLLACGVGLILSIQVIINIAMSMGLAPVVGLPLPLLSYGGSSFLVTCLCLGIVINIEKRSFL